MRTKTGMVSDFETRFYCKEFTLRNEILSQCAKKAMTFAEANLSIAAKKTIMESDASCNIMLLLDISKSNYNSVRRSSNYFLS